MTYLTLKYWEAPFSYNGGVAAGSGNMKMQNAVVKLSINQAVATLLPGLEPIYHLSEGCANSCSISPRHPETYSCRPTCRRRLLNPDK